MLNYALMHYNAWLISFCKRYKYARKSFIGNYFPTKSYCTRISIPTIPAAYIRGMHGPEKLT